jgi:hypothetical protein
MFDINQIYKIDNFLDEDEVKGFDVLCDHYVWELAGYSYSADKMFWLKDLWESKLGKCLHIEETFRFKIQSLLNIKLVTERMYLNGQAHGQCGSIHTDIIYDVKPEDDYITAIYYVNKQWSPEYGGFTVVIDKQDQMHINYPKPNSVLVFDSSLPHVGLEPTMHCKSQRITMAHKMRILKE